MNCWAERKGCCCHLIRLHCDRETVGWDLCDFGRIPEAMECVGIPRIPCFFEYEKVHSTKQSSPTCQHISSQKICAIKLIKFSRSCFHYDDNHCLWYPWRGQSRTSNVGSYEAQPLDTDAWSYGLHRRKWNNCNGHGNIELPKSVKYLWILSIFIKVMSQDPIWHTAFRGMLSGNPSNGTLNILQMVILFEKRMIFNFQCSISSHKTLVVDLPYLPLPHENHRKVV